MSFKVILVSLLLPCLLLAAAGSVISDFNQTPDESFTQIRGKYFLENWSAFDLEAARKELGPVLINYGPLFDVAAAAGARRLQKEGLVTDPVVAQHVPVLVSAAVAVWATFMLARALFGSVTAGMLASLNLVLLPRFFGASVNNPKDIPFCAFFTLALLLLVQMEQRRSLFRAACAGVMIGASYAVRVSAIFIFPVFLPWLLWTAKGTKDWLGSGTRLLVSAASALLTIPLFWPLYRFEPWQRFKETIGLFADHPWTGQTLYLGTLYPGRAVPWHYALTLSGVTTPLYILLFASAALLLSLAIRENSTSHEHKRASLLLFCWFVIPLLTHGLSHSPKYDSIRHYIFTFPALAILSAGAMQHFGQRLRTLHRQSAFYLYAGLIGALILQQLAELRRIHPYQSLYFNELTGGLRGAAGRFELDYWGQSLQEGGRWLGENAPPQSRLKMAPQWPALLRLGSHDLKIISATFDHPGFFITRRKSFFEPPPALSNNSPAPVLVYSSGVAGVELVRVYEYPENRMLRDRELLPASRPFLLHGKAGLQLSTFQNQSFSGPARLETVSGPEVAEITEGAVSRRFSGYLLSPARETRCFRLYSDDIASWMLDKRLAVHSDSGRTFTKVLTLDSGFHGFTAEHRSSGGRSCMQLTWAAFDEKQNACGRFDPLPQTLFFHEGQGGPGNPGTVEALAPPPANLN